jgi:hypothetical protein
MGIFLWANDNQIIYQTIGVGFFQINLDGTGLTPINLILPLDVLGAIGLEVSEQSVTLVTCDFTISPADTPALLSAIATANTTPEPDTICLEAGTYTLDAPITSDITLHGLGAGAEIIGSLQVSGAGRLTLRNVTVTP